MSVHQEWITTDDGNPEVVDEHKAREYGLASDEPIEHLALVLGGDTVFMVEAKNTDALRNLAAQIVTACDDWDARL